MPLKRILVIDDEKDLVKVIKVRIESAGYEAITAYSGDEGVKKSVQEKPDLILLDIFMPQMSGFDVLRKLRENMDTRYIPVIMVTCEGASKAIFEASDLGCVDYIIKPFDLNELLKVIKKYINY